MPKFLEKKEDYEKIKALWAAWRVRMTDGQSTEAAQDDKLRRTSTYSKTIRQRASEGQGRKGGQVIYFLHVLSNSTFLKDCFERLPDTAAAYTGNFCLHTGIFRPRTNDWKAFSPVIE